MESGDGKQSESKARDRRDLGDNGAGRGENERVGLDIHTDEFSFYLPLHEPRVGRTKKSSHGHGPVGGQPVRSADRGGGAETF